MSRPVVAARSVRRALRRHRRVLAGLCTALAVWSALRVVAPAPPALEALVVARRDLPAGATLRPGDLTTARLPPDAVPEAAGGAAEVVGRVLAAPVRRGEALTDVRLRPPGGVRPPPGSVVVTVRTADPAAVLVVRPGDRVDILAGPGPGSAVDPGEVGPETLADGVLVLAVPGRSGAHGGADDGADGAAGGEEPSSAGSSGLLGGGASGGADPEAGGTSVDTAGVLVVATDRGTAARLAAATGRALTVAVVTADGWGSPQSPRGEDQGP